MPGNNAINVNYGNTISYAGGVADISITTNGSDWYWAVCAVMAASTMAFLGLAYTKPREERVFHYITAGITMVASIAYFSMASNIGWTPISVEFHRPGTGTAGLAREIFYVRYIDWFITTPLLLLDLLLTAALPWPTLLWAILIDEIMIVTGLIGALVVSSYKFGYYTFGCAALFYIAYLLVWEGRRNAQLIGSDVGRTFFLCGTWTIFLWFLYPVAWGLCEGGNILTPDGEAYFYGVLDLMAKPVFGALLLWGHQGINPARLGINVRPYGVPFGGIEDKGTARKERPERYGGRPTNGAINGTTNGNTNGTTNGTTNRNTSAV